ncbi:hypothetical protein R3P38DRAFT_2815666 [Favolaschia claudopus]|uniref:Uncharacterized protein n=1 Tax=Favolaschia claudopus TaxID=2862362 RepID=A0AAV9Z0W8_9AGAR
MYVLDYSLVHTQLLTIFKAVQRTSKTTISAVDATTHLQVWDGWPNGRFQLLFTTQQVADTTKLAVNWSCEARSPGQRGSASSISWERGKELRRRCIGALCLCGEDLGLVSSRIELTTFFFRDGACFSHSGDHTHSKYTHSLVFQSREPFNFTEYIEKRPISLSVHSGYFGDAFASVSEPEDTKEDFSSADQSEEVEVNNAELFVAGSEPPCTDAAGLQEEADDPEANLAED